MKPFKSVILLLIILLITSCYRQKPVTNYDIQKTAIGQKAMVVTAHPVATDVGLRVLKAGGNAIDAAIAVQFALAVVYPNAGNIGGGGFMVIRKKNGRPGAIDFREKAPMAATRDMYLDSLEQVIPGLSVNGHLAAGVPGTVAGMLLAHGEHGKLNFNELVQYAVTIAEEGFSLTAAQAENLNSYQEKFKSCNTSTPVFVKDTPWKALDLLVQKDLAQTLKAIRDHGREGFYEGPVADKIVAEMKAGGGIITKADLKSYEAKWREPLLSEYKDYSLISMPPPSSGGIALVQLLNMVKDYPLKEWGFQSKRAVQLIVEAERRVYADRAKFLGDSDFYDVPIKALTTKIYADARMINFDSTMATPSDSIKGGLIKKESEETTHFSIVDEEGHAVAVTTTLNSGFGSKTVVSGAGFLLNNEMDDFSSKPGVPNIYGLVGAEANAIEPGKRMLSSMTPTIVEKDDKLFMVVGTPGGSTIITSVFQVILNVIEYEMSMTEAVQADRFHHQWLPDLVSVEKDALSDEVRSGLIELGYKIKERGTIGRVDAILVTEGGLEGAADQRGDDHAAGY